MAKHILFLGKEKKGATKEIVGETEKAWKIETKVSFKGKVRRTYIDYLPKSEVEVHDGFISMPQWLAKKVGADRIIFAHKYPVDQESPILTMTAEEAVAKLETGETKISN